MSKGMANFMDSIRELTPEAKQRILEGKWRVPDVMFGITATDDATSGYGGQFPGGIGGVAVVIEEGGPDFEFGFAEMR